ncbi:unnamed protein product [Arctia plantaginis]|uniref:Venom serine protease 34 n=1 Tax=Arctia plantaginis TaxID=874455 RepID=A0A8S0Z9S4_ARCPL|nr:unnamed protein product [Arctia plantaginis]
MLPKMKFDWVLLFWFLREVVAQDNNCNYYQNVAPTRTANILSPNYPSNYRPGIMCRWIVDCPTGYNCRLDCPEISLPPSTSCMLDRLLVSKSGDSQLAAADTYCGKRTLSVVSTRQRIVLGLITTANSNGGRFMCQVSAQPVNLTTNCSCGLRRRNRIVGGKETGINEYPMMVGIVDARIIQIKCGATIISRRYVLTAAHCLTGLIPEQTAILVGEHNVSSNDSPATKGYRVASFIPHSQYSDSNYDYDIALIRAREAIEFSDRVGPVCLPFKFENDDFYGKKVTVLGWGTIFVGGPVSSVLLEADLDVISQTECKYKEPSVTNRQICTFTRGKDACQDDSGGPLLYTDPQTALLFVVGIVSSGRSCATGDFPGINTRVTAFLNWIVTTTQDNFCPK